MERDSRRQLELAAYGAPGSRLQASDEPVPPTAERGAALVLTLFIVIILFVIVSQMHHSVRMDVAVAYNDVLTTQMDLAARGAIEQAKLLLADDATGTSGLVGEFEEEAQNAAEGGDETTDTGSEDQPVDHVGEPWADPTQTLFSFGELQAWVVIEPENSKFNLLSLLAEDEEQRAGFLQRLARLIAAYREGTPYELSSADSRWLAENIFRFMTDAVARGGIPLPPLKLHHLNLDQEGDAEAEDEAASRGFEEPAPTFPPLTIDDLLMVEGMNEEILYDVEVEGEIFPGLSNFLTIHSAIQDTKGLMLTEGGRINLNTAPRPVIQVLLPPGIGRTVAEEIEILRQNPPPSECEHLFENEEPTTDPFGYEQPVRFYFKSLPANLECVSSYNGASEYVLTKEDRFFFERIVTVESAVFSLWVKVRHPDFARSRLIHAIVLRGPETEAGDIQMIPIIPWTVRHEAHPYLFPPDLEAEQFGGNFDLFGTGIRSDGSFGTGRYP